jgi:hypothetical protein
LLDREVQPAEEAVAEAVAVQAVTVERSADDAWLR